jgi:hypothetical protein
MHIFYLNCDIFSITDIDSHFLGVFSKGGFLYAGQGIERSGTMGSADAGSKNTWTSAGRSKRISHQLSGRKKRGPELLFLEVKKEGSHELIRAADEVLFFCKSYVKVSR